MCPWTRTIVPAASGINKYDIKILQYHCTATKKKQANLGLSEDWGSSLLAA